MGLKDFRLGGNREAKAILICEESIRKGHKEDFERAQEKTKSGTDKDLEAIPLQN